MSQPESTSVQRKCNLCGCTFDAAQRRRRICLACDRKQRRENMRKRLKLDHRDVRAELIAEKGGRCVRCGYSEFVESLQFHHRSSRGKDNHINVLIARHCYSNTPASLEACHREIAKCDLLCANCHRALHAGAYTR